MFRLLLIAASALVVFSQDATTKPPVEANELEKFRFAYESHTHHMTLATGDVCYVFTLSDGERNVVHSDFGLRALELKLLSSLSTATMTEVQQDKLNHRVVSSCGRGHFTHFYSVQVV